MNLEKKLKSNMILLKINGLNSIKKTESKDN